jgi:hypothetical protein
MDDRVVVKLTVATELDIILAMRVIHKITGKCNVKEAKANQDGQKPPGTRHKQMP